jgi:hypothetical protein
VRSRWPLIVALVVIGLLVFLWRSARDEEPPPKSEEASPTERVEAARRAPRAPEVEPPKPRAVATQPAMPFDASSRHTADPCTALSEPYIPPGFEQITEGPITVAWDPNQQQAGPFDAPLRPVALAHATLGILEEAAQLTGTDRREKLAVIVDASSDDLQKRTRVPSWVGGLYDGGAVHLFAKNADLGVVMQTLRHEIMHAQMHAAVGCTPFWFNEGMANYFAGGVPTREWLAMLRTQDAFDLAALNDPALFDLAKENVSRLYAVSLAMVSLLVHRGSEQNLRAAIRIAQENNSHADAVKLWARIAPNIEYRDVLESLAQKTFGVPIGTELEAVLKGPICCKHLNTPSELSCRAAQQGELGVSKGYYCRARW